jgi:glycosyltransferase involved in cell wall biosynthesis
VIAVPFPILVVTPTLGDSPWLDDTVASVANQSHRCRHVLVCPAAKVDELAQRFPAVEVYAEPGGGMYAAINAGLAAAGAWGAFTYINDDDLLLPDFSRVAAAAQTTAEALFYGGVRLINTHGKRIGAIPISRLSGSNRLLYAQRVEPVYQHGTIATRAVYDRIGGFDASFRFCGDSEFLARCCVSKIPCRRVGWGVIAAFRLRAGQLTKNLPVMLEEHHRLYNKLKLPAARLTWRHRWARFVFYLGNAGVYVERIWRYGFIGFGEVLARVE